MNKKAFTSLPDPTDWWWRIGAIVAGVIGVLVVVGILMAVTHSVIPLLVALALALILALVIQWPSFRRALTELRAR